MQELLKQWAEAVANALFYEATGLCAPHGARRAALRRARMAAQRAQRLEKILRDRYATDPWEKLRNGEIK